MRERKSVKILDIGGGAGFFSREMLKQVMEEGSKVQEIDIYLIDTNRYDTWNDDDKYIHYIEGDALNMDLIYGGF